MVLFYVRRRDQGQRPKLSAAHFCCECPALPKLCVKVQCRTKGQRLREVHRTTKRQALLKGQGWPYKAWYRTGRCSSTDERNALQKEKAVEENGARQMTDRDRKEREEKVKKSDAKN